MEVSNNYNVFVIAVQIITQILVIKYFVENWFAGLSDYYKRGQYFWAFIAFWNPLCGFFNGLMVDIKKHCGVSDFTNADFFAALLERRRVINAERKVKT